MSYPETVKALTGRRGYSSPLTTEDAEHLAAWQAGNNGSGARRWFVSRQTITGAEANLTKRGTVARDASYETAKKKADALNTADPHFVEYWGKKAETPDPNPGETARPEEVERWVRCVWCNTPHTAAERECCAPDGSGHLFDLVPKPPPSTPSTDDPVPSPPGA